jgi:uncharacterized protein (TIGR02284 family)
MQTTQEMGTALNHAIQACRNSQQGFEAAAKGIKDPSLQAEFLQYVQQRRSFIDELQSLVAELDELPREAGTFGGAMHRGWMQIREAMSTNDRYALLAECERGEDWTLDAYREVIASDLTSRASLILNDQCQQIQRVHDRIRALREVARGM